MTSASAVSRVIGRELGVLGRARVEVFSEGGAVYVRGWNGTRHSAAAISRARRVLVASGYDVKVVSSDGLTRPLPDGPRMCRGPWIGGHAFRLTVSKGGAA